MISNHAGFECADFVYPEVFVQIVVDSVQGGQGGVILLGSNTQDRRGCFQEVSSAGVDSERRR